MRLWSIHPTYLDTKGLVAVWREGLLAQKMLGDTFLMGKGGHVMSPYYNHPQLTRFKNTERPLRVIGQYLTEIYKEAERRDYKFDASKIIHFYRMPIEELTVTSGQLLYEFNHLQNKLWHRDKNQYQYNSDRRYFDEKIDTHPLFKVIKGDIESWEKLPSKS